MSAGLEVEAASVRLGGAPVLRELSLRVAAGSRTVLVGSSGAGKTTLLRAIAGLVPLDAGAIRLDGRSLAGVPAHRRGVAVVFQEPRLLAHVSVAENVALPLRAARASRAERARRAAEQLAAVGLDGFAERRVPGLSGGEQQRVALARALCAEPGLVLLDEPLAALDPERRQQLRRLLVELQEARGLTLLLVTHDRAEAAELGERVALLTGGRILQEGPPRELFARPASVEAARFLGMTNLLAGTVRDGMWRPASREPAEPPATVDAGPASAAPRPADAAPMPPGPTGVPLPGPDGPAILGVRPEHVRVVADGPLRARVLEAVFTGDAVRVELDADGVRLEALLPPEDGPVAGSVVALAFAHVHRLPPAP